MRSRKKVSGLRLWEFVGNPPKIASLEQVSSPFLLKFGPYIVDLAAAEVRKNGSRNPVQEKPLSVLTLLAERQGELVTREESDRSKFGEPETVYRGKRICATGKISPFKSPRAAPG